MARQESCSKSLKARTISILFTTVTLMPNIEPDTRHMLNKCFLIQSTLSLSHFFFFLAAWLGF